MNVPNHRRARGFSLIETVIAIGVLAVLLSGFMIVFAPAAAGIRKSLNSQDAARLVSTLEQELVTLRGDYDTGFEKAFEYIKDSQGALQGALLVYKYRADPNAEPRNDGTLRPVESINNMVPGRDYVVQNMMRRYGRESDEERRRFYEDLPSVEGPVYLVKCTQLQINSNGELALAPHGQISNVAGEEPLTASRPEDYKHAVITFVADFYALPAKSEGFFTNQFAEVYTNAIKPVFSRNLAVRR